MVPNIEYEIISSFWGIEFYLRNIILLGSTTKKNYSHEPQHISSSGGTLCKTTKIQKFRAPDPTHPSKSYILFLGGTS